MNQKIKIFAVSFVLVLGAVLFLGTGCAEKAATLTGQITGQLTDEDKCVELMAHSMLAPSYGQNMAGLEALQQKVDNLKKQYGWSDEDITNHCQKFQDNQEDFMNRLGKRMKELLSEIK